MQDLAKYRSVPYASDLELISETVPTGGGDMISQKVLILTLKLYLNKPLR